MKHLMKLTFTAGIFATALSAGAQIDLMIPGANQGLTYTYLDAYKPLKNYPVADKLASYKTIRLTADLSKLSAEEKLALVYMIKAARHADNIFWKQSYGDKDSVLARTSDENLKKFLLLNYGPWDRLNDDQPFVEGIGPKPAGARFYPEDMTKEQYEQKFMGMAQDPYSVVGRSPMGDLEQMPYFMAYQTDIMAINDNLMRAAMVIGPEKNRLLFEYLRSRAESMMLNNYQQSDIAWLNVKDASLDIIIGPIENYEDKLFGTRTSFEAYVLIRDKEWGARLEKYLKYLPDLQKNLPVDSAYKTETVENGNSQLAVFDAVYYAGDCNSGSKTIAVNLPNDEVIQKNYGTRRSQLKNVMQAKFDNMVLPISQLLIDPAQRASVNFNAFFSNVMFHEVAHGLGIKNTITGKGTVRDALGPGYSALEECKADVLGLYMVTQLFDKGELEGKLEDYYVTFTASVFRSVRFGASSAHGKANMITFNTLIADGAITRQANNTYKVNVEKMRMSIEKLAGDLLRLQGDGDAIASDSYIAEKAVVKPTLTADLNRVNKAGIPVDLIFEQGLDVLGLEE